MTTVTLPIPSGPATMAARWNHMAPRNKWKIEELDEEVFDAIDKEKCDLDELSLYKQPLGLIEIDRTYEKPTKLADVRYKLEFTGLKRAQAESILNAIEDEWGPKKAQPAKAGK
jgi:hypothetical protein